MWRCCAVLGLAGGLLALPAPTQADQLLRFNGGVEAATFNLTYDGGATTDQVHFFRRWGGGGCFRPAFHCFRPCWGWGCHRPYYYSYRVYHGGWCPISYDDAFAPPPLVLGMQPASPLDIQPNPLMPPAPNGANTYPYEGNVRPPVVQPPPLNGSRTYPYDGGPRNPPPLPRNDSNPTYVPIPKQPANAPNTRLVSLTPYRPAATGFSPLSDTANTTAVLVAPRVSASANGNVNRTRSPAASYTYPAYGEQFVPNSNRSRR